MIKYITLFLFLAVCAFAEEYFEPKTIEEEITKTPRNPQTGIIKGAEPYFHAGNDTAVLLLHGFTGSPANIMPLCSAFSERGFTVDAPLLPGHGRYPNNLDTVKAEDYLNFAERRLKHLRKNKNFVIVCGFSLGGSISAGIAQRGAKVNRLVLIAPYFRIRYHWFYFLSPEKWTLFASRFVQHIRKTEPGKVNKESAYSKIRGYWYFSVSSVIETIELNRIVMEKAPKVKCPLFIIHSENDDVTSPSASRKFLRQTSSHEKKYREFQKSNHIILLDHESDQAIEEILEWSTKSL
ncbi:MAG: alpha/beta hydrolase [Fibrobacterota bacterium]